MNNAGKTLGAGAPVNWDSPARSLVCLLAASPPADDDAPPTHHILFMYHGGVDAKTFRVPALARSASWRLFIDTAAESPVDVHPELDGPRFPANGKIRLQSHSLVCYMAADFR